MSARTSASAASLPRDSSWRMRRLVQVAQATQMAQVVQVAQVAQTARAAGASRAATPRGRAAGFSLIEVLVSIFIVALGILALAGLLQSASRYGKMSELRSTATLLANDLADRVRANPGGAMSTTPAYDLVSPSYPAPAPAEQAWCGVSAHCTPEQLAKADLYFWSQRLKTMLPGGSAYVHYQPATSTTLGSVDIWVAWTDPTTSPLGTVERAANECPAAWQGAAATVRCVYLPAGL